MQSDRHELIERAFHAASDLPADHRADFLNAVCDGDPELRADVERLLAAASKARQNPAWTAGAFVSEASFTARQFDSTELDRYRLQDRIGSGGMGLVYKAVRADDAFAKTVAIKIVHAAPGDASVLQRFQQERQILARLEHPNIARLLDGGTTSDGLPYLVMEYVEGVTLTNYLAASSLTTRAILQLFEKICAAVSYAHRNLIVHRDLKPANILVTKEGEPKLLDFGVATLADGSGLRTATGAGAMTPEYASPEQILGEPISTASDIYSLGVLLYEMLTGSYPWPRSGSRLELAKAITTETALPLSRQSGKRFDPDLETIVQMAMRKEPQRRYNSVEQFSGDISRYLNGYPVSARPDTSGYRLRKFARRNRLALAAAALILLTVAGGIAATLRQARIANRRFEDVRTLATAYLFEFHDTIKDLPGSTPARQLVVKRALEYLARLSSERGNDPVLGLELASAYARTAAIQGQTESSSLGDRPGAISSYGKAIEILEHLPRNPDIARELADDYAELGFILAYTGDLKSAVPDERKAVNLGAQALAANPHDNATRETLVTAHMDLGDVLGNPNYQNIGETKAAIEEYKKARQVLQNLSGPKHDPLAANLAGKMAQLYQAIDDKPAAVASYKDALEMDERIYRNAPLNAQAQWDAAAANHNLALSLLRIDAAQEAKQYGDRSLDLWEKYAAADPKNVEAQVTLADGYYAQGFVRAKAKETADAFTWYDRAVAAYESIMAAHPGSVIPPGLRTTYQLLTDLNNQTGDHQHAIVTASKELAIDEQLLKANPSNAGAQRNKALASRQTGQAYQAMGEDPKLPTAQRETQLHQALLWYQRGLDIYQAQKSAGTLTAMYAVDIPNIQGYMAKINKELANH